MAGHEAPAAAIQNHAQRRQAAAVSVFPIRCRWGSCSWRQCVAGLRCPTLIACSVETATGRDG